MQPIQLFDLASRQAQWLAVRQNVVAGNIANANTPHYAAKDVKPFESVLQETGFQMAADQSRPFHRWKHRRSGDGNQPDQRCRGPAVGQQRRSWNRN